MKEPPIVGKIRAGLVRELAWATRAPVGEATWARIRQQVAAELVSRWYAGELLGAKPEQAFFVRCDRTTMTQNDLDNGRLIVLVGVAVLRPAEFVIIRIDEAREPAVVEAHPPVTWRCGQLLRVVQLRRDLSLPPDRRRPGRPLDPRRVSRRPLVGDRDRPRGRRPARRVARRCLLTSRLQEPAERN